MSRRPNTADSAGQPWAGRSFEPNAFASDDGSAPEELASAIRAFRDGSAGPEGVVEAFRSARLLIPLLAAAGDVGETAEGLVVDKTQELSIVTVTAPDGRRVLPVFSSVTAMSAWRPDARPVPADGVRVALAAAGDSTDLVVLDPTSDTEFGFRRPMVWAVAQGHEWSAPWLDDRVRSAVAASVAPEDSVAAFELVPGDPHSRLVGAEVDVQLFVKPGLDRDAISSLVSRLSARWAADESVATAVDSLSVSIRAASDR
ncbi:MAG: SseB family protein [Mycetocola sp.]